MKPWKHLNVFGRLIPLFKAPGLIEEIEAYGIFTVVDPRKNDIRIAVDAGLKGDVLMQTVLHEMFHAVIHRTNSMDELNEEALVDQFATAIVENFDLKFKNKN